jgi:hypothetical protein
VSFAPLQSSCFKCPDRWFPTLSLGIRPGCAFRRRHRCRSVGRQPYLSAPPSTCSPASTPAPALLPSLRSRSATFAIPFRPHRFARSRRFSPPIAPFTELCAITGAGFAGLLHPAADPGVRCVSFVMRVEPSPHTGRFWSVCRWSRESRFPAARFIPFGGCPPPAAVSCRHDRCLPGVRFPRGLDRGVAAVASVDVRVGAT